MRHNQRYGHDANKWGQISQPSSIKTNPFCNRLDEMNKLQNSDTNRQYIVTPEICNAFLANADVNGGLRD